MTLFGNNYGQEISFNRAVGGALTRYDGRPPATKSLIGPVSGANVIPPEAPSTWSGPEGMAPYDGRNTLDSPNILFSLDWQFLTRCTNSLSGPSLTAKVGALGFLAPLSVKPKTAAFAGAGNPLASSLAKSHKSAHSSWAKLASSVVATIVRVASAMYCAELSEMFF